MYEIPSEFAITEIYMPPLLPVGLAALVLTMLTVRLLNRYRLARYFYYPPLVFVALLVIYMGIISYAGPFGVFYRGEL